MNCEEITNLLPGWMNDNLSVSERAAIEQHLPQCPDCLAELAMSRHLWQQLGTVPTPAPRPEVRTQFYAMLDSFETEQKASRSGSWTKALASLQTLFRQSVMPVPRLAYSLVLLAVGIAGGYWFHSPNTTTVAVQQQQIDTLSTQVQEMREMMMLSLLENPSATERLRAVSYTKDISDVNSQVIDALLMTLNNDPNVNVRLVTLEALADLAHDPRVREGLVQSLMRQESPLVQVELADVMVKLQEKRSLKPMRQLLRQPGTNDLVKSKLEQTIKQLS